MKKALPWITAFLCGAVISMMVICNTELGKATSNEVSITINQIVGIVILSAILWSFPKNRIVNPERKKAPWWMYFGGLFGVVILSVNYFAVTGIGATIAMGGSVFGQSLMGLFMDMTGFMGMKKEKVTKKRAMALIISGIGVVLPFFSGEEMNAWCLILSILAGFIIMIQMVYNAKLALLRGAFSSARVNVISGLIGALLYAFICFPTKTIEGFRALPSVPFLLIIMGGTLAVFVVVSSNVVIPKIPAVYSALLISSGQILTAVMIDIFLYDIFNPWLLGSALLMLLGIFVSFEKKKA